MPGVIEGVRNATEDFAIMAWNRNLVLSRSTFGYAAVWLSPFRKRLWTFHNPSMFAVFGSYSNCVADDKYIALVLNNWQGTHTQKQMMLDHNCTFKLVPGMSGTSEMQSTDGDRSN
jgi:hypothetical protein